MAYHLVKQGVPVDYLVKALKKDTLKDIADYVF